jgi:hypothetical protein
MDWQNHEDFNHPLIIIVTLITLLSVIAGIILIPTVSASAAGANELDGDESQC